MLKPTYYTAALLLLLLTACSSGENKAQEKEQEQNTEVKPETELEKASWLLGTWINDVPNGRVTEFWEKQSDSVFVGQSFFISKGDTLTFESLRLVQEGNQLVYRPLVRGQNNNLPVEFRSSGTVKEQLIFENPNHDFPQKIAYWHTAGDSLKVEISGLLKNEFQSDLFTMGRLK